jgi:hypothetical protein
VNDDLLLSLYLDARLAGAERQAFERRLAAEPALRARLEQMRRLQALSAGLAPVSATFGADDVRVRAGIPSRFGGRRLGLAAAAVLALAATHAAVYAVGARHGAEAQRAERHSLEQTAALLQRTAEIDVAAPPKDLETEIATLRREIPTRLVALARAREPEAATYVDALRQIGSALEQPRDPAFLCLQVALIAKTSLDGGADLRFVPATATSYLRVVPVGDGRYQMIRVADVNGTPRTVVDEGTPEELEARSGIRLQTTQPPKRK